MSHSNRTGAPEGEKAAKGQAPSFAAERDKENAIHAKESESKRGEATIKSLAKLSLQSPPTGAEQWAA